MKGVLWALFVIGCDRTEDGAEGSTEFGQADDTGADDTAPPQELVIGAQIAGEYGTLSGYAIAGAGDMNGDGIGDFLIGAPGYDCEDIDHVVLDPSVGRAYVMHGSLADSNMIANAPTTMFGERAGDGAGTALVAGDLNGDGSTDVVVGAPYADLAGVRTGVAYVLYDVPTGDVLLSSAQRLPGEADGGNFGWRVGLADVNGDGIPNLAVGSPLDGGGAVSIYATGTSGVGERLGVVRAVGDNDMLGNEVGFTDLDGDGLSEVVAAAPGYDGDGTDRGAVYVFTVGLGQMTANASDVVIQGESSWSAGKGIAAGDMDGDGYGDLLVGAPGRNDGEVDDVGMVAYLRGPLEGAMLLEDAADATLRGSGEGDMVGMSVAVVGDVDDDGAQDVAIGVERYDEVDAPAAGRVYLIYGTLRGDQVLDQSADGYLRGPGLPYGHMGKTVAGLGDVTGDGIDDWAASAPPASLTDSMEGYTYLFYGDRGLSE